MKYLTAEDIIKINVMVIGKYSPNEPVQGVRISILS